jgi:predicted Fe-Mo cluster-binding NifX family protein
VLDVARHLVVVDVEGNAEVGRREAELAQAQLGARAEQIRGLGVEILICGAVSRPLEAMLVSAGVRVIPHTCGRVEHVLQAFLAGQLPNEAFLMPGCCGPRLRFRGGRHHGGPLAAGRWRGMV